MSFTDIKKPKLPLKVSPPWSTTGAKTQTAIIAAYNTNNKSFKLTLKSCRALVSPADASGKKQIQRRHLHQQQQRQSSQSRQTAHGAPAACQPRCPLGSGESSVGPGRCVRACAQRRDGGNEGGTNVEGSETRYSSSAPKQAHC